MRFGFNAPWFAVYRVCLPAILVWSATTLWFNLHGADGGVLWVLGATALLWPAMHALLKSLQHGHASFGHLRFEFVPATKGFYDVYLGAFGLVVAATILNTLVVVGMTLLLRSRPGFSIGQTYATVATLLSGLVAFLACWPFWAAKMQQLVWSRTTIGPVRFRSDMKPRPMWKLVLRNTVLTLLTAGLYWPFAAVAIARYRVQSLVLVSVRPLSGIVAHRAQHNDAIATGDAAADFFDLDIGW
jgi:uncharacterized membrane protein YjgN (DUF898 family)